MQVSAEIRWFWCDEPRVVKSWFVDTARHGCAPGGVGGRVRVDDHGARVEEYDEREARADDYLDEPGQLELGAKVRGKKPGIEIKGLIEVQPGLSPHGAFAAPVEIWGKWPSARLEIDPSKRVRVSKWRLLRKFDTDSGIAVEIPLGKDEAPLADRPLPALGCHVEFTRIGVADGGIAWTLGIEAFGPLDTLKRTLHSTAAVLEARTPPSMASGELASYPLWLSRRKPKVEVRAPS